STTIRTSKLPACGSPRLTSWRLVGTRRRMIPSKALTFARHVRRVPGVDLLLILGLAGAVLGLIGFGREWTVAIRPAVDIDLDSPWHLLLYTFYSLTRGLIAYVLSLGFTLVYGYWAAKDPVAQRVLVPLLDILQSIPVLSFLPGVVLALAAL